MGTAVIPW